MKCTEYRESTSHGRTYLLDRFHYPSVTERGSGPRAGVCGAALLQRAMLGDVPKACPWAIAVFMERRELTTCGHIKSRLRGQGSFIK